MIDDLFQQYVKTPSDINEHLQYMHDFCVEHNVKQVVELGVRGGASTVAFLAAMEKTQGQLWSCDVNQPTTPEEVNQHPRWDFQLGDDLSLISPDCDLVFIDTTHEYGQTLMELALYASSTRLAIMLHDTQLERMPWLHDQPPFPVRTAIEEFLAGRPDQWDFSERPFNNGLVTLRKKS